nr:MAG TPA: hypothetical protein [Caudoviricetes sp.]
MLSNIISFLSIWYCCFSYPLCESTKKLRRYLAIL